jgi:hypothetical protein
MEPSPVLSAVVTALAGVRDHQSVIVLGEAGMIRRALTAGTGCDLVVEGPADVVVAMSAPDVPGAVSLLRPGGRLVAVAADTGAVERTATRHGLQVQHAEKVGTRVAWSGRLPA